MKGLWNSIRKGTCCNARPSGPYRIGWPLPPGRSRSTTLRRWAMKKNRPGFPTGTPGARAKPPRYWRSVRAVPALILQSNQQIEPGQHLGPVDRNPLPVICFKIVIPDLDVTQGGRPTGRPYFWVVGGVSLPPGHLVPPRRPTFIRPELQGGPVVGKTKREGDGEQAGTEQSAVRLEDISRKANIGQNETEQNDAGHVIVALIEPVAQKQGFGSDGQHC